MHLYRIWLQPALKIKEEEEAANEPMEDENSQILEHAHSEFKRQNFKEAEELYTKFISSCLKSR